MAKTKCEKKLLLMNDIQFFHVTLSKGAQKATLCLKNFQNFSQSNARLTFLQNAVIIYYVIALKSICRLLTEFSYSLLHFILI